MATDTSQLRNKLATRTQGDVAQNGAGEEPVAVVVRKMIERQASAFRAVLPDTVDHDRFARLVMVAIKANPKLIRCFDTDLGQTSVLFSAMQAAALGLEPNTPMEHCWFQPRNRSVKDERGEWVKVAECELSIGYRGYIKLMMDTGKVKEVDAVAVHQHDDFGWSRGLGGNKLHYTAGEAEGDESTLTHAYCVVRFKKKAGGGQQFVVLNRRQVLARREKSPSWQADQKYGKTESPWSRWPEVESMWMKSAIRAAVKMVDLSREVSVAAGADEARLALSDGGTLVALPYQPPAGELEQAPAGVDPDTGEIEATASEIVDAEVNPETGDVEHADIGEDAAAANREAGERDVAAAEKMSRPQQAKIFASLKERDIEDRLDRLAWASGSLGREIGSFNQLTRADANTLIDKLEALARADASTPAEADQ